MNQFTAAELIAQVAANRANWVKVKLTLKARSEYTSENEAALAVAVTAADKARAAHDGYFSHA